MSSNTKVLSIIAGISLVVAIGLIFGSASFRGVGDLGSGGGSGGVGLAAGKEAPNFTLQDLNGKNVALSSFRGKVIFLNLWATWCPPCRSEMPSIQSLYKTFAKDKDFVTLTVSEDSDVSKPPAYIKKNKFDFPVLLDPRNVVGEAYDVSGLPESFVIGRDGRIVAHHIGPYDWANGDIRDALQDLLKAKPG
ncbi:MAG TPA: TlpA disulfide reductase family protein [Candidatus Binataceae bacterium]|nr:TlpA disulfide reductase family protein [Candidatus Binataceae bacterium]